MKHDTFVIESGYLKTGFKQDPANLTQTIAPGTYKLGWYSLERAYTFSPVDLSTTQPVTLDNQIYKEVYEYINRFNLPSTQEKYAKWNMPHKTGILLYGAPGTGKTCLIKSLLNSLTKEGFVALLDPAPNLLGSALLSLKNITNKHIPIVVVWEELEQYLLDNEAEVLEILDGLIQHPEVIYIATTNYIKDIPPRIKQRPSRFTLVLEVKAPNIQERINYISLYLTDLGRIKEIAEITEGMVLDQIKNLLLYTECLELPIQKAMEYLKNDVAE